MGCSNLAKRPLGLKITPNQLSARGLLQIPRGVASQILHPKTGRKGLLFDFVSRESFSGLFERITASIELQHMAVMHQAKDAMLRTSGSGHKFVRLSSNIVRYLMHGKTVCPLLAVRRLALHCASEGCSGVPSRSSSQEDEPWQIIGKHLSESMWPS
ncbi:protein of unknown function [Bradyrhizobium vignae]|uniref:Uncharacterized protein n=1 Tax=Bradyrhizobium vignae TaxID=1549949 RepID=A0A2U3Q9S9_9BRAD|nr:protein of unknown function [Bradyrhizobium vignae]